MPRSRTLPKDVWDRARPCVRQLRADLGMTWEEVARAAELADPKSLGEVMRPNGRRPSRPLFADLSIALRSGRLMTLMMPPGWRALSPDETARLHAELARARELVAGLDGAAGQPELAAILDAVSALLAGC